MRCLKPVAAALILLTAPARAQLDESYVDPNTPPPPVSSTAPVAKPPPAEPAVRVVVRSMPKRLKYESDDRIPFGYRVQEKTGEGLIISGAVICGLSGALLGHGIYQATDGKTEGELEGVGAVLGGVGLAVGIPLLLSGLFYTPKKILVRNDARLTVSPVIAQHTFGTSLAVTF